MEAAQRSSAEVFDLPAGLSATAMLDAGMRVMHRKKETSAYEEKEQFSRSAPARTSSFGPAATEEEEGGGIDRCEDALGVWKVRSR